MLEAPYRIRSLQDQLDSFACNLERPRKRLHALKLAECPLSEVPLYCVSQTGRNFLSVLRVREVSVFGVFFCTDINGNRSGLA